MSSSPGYKSLNHDGRSSSTNTCCCSKSWRKCPCYGKACIVIAAIICVFVAVVFSAAGVYSVFYPIHASCKINWSFNASCDVVQTKIVQQINDWKGADMCNGTQRCLYLLKGNKAGVKTTATHETPKKHYIDDLTFDFSSASDGSCQVKGYSTSETWYAVLDYGTNYCNLNNLITGSGVDKLPAYTETTSDSVCTQYSIRNCDVY
ncbi:uncharacterized protein LOC110466566 [Mizuhopecten yessoensis]|uniref:Uncharacterized protein n=1 Tax=Mizuhopecten yessoensis TaxID=6573 RepID=A0A210PNX3_MIZYE|nr:uncharacterized protein LOC110466566 [Mizuhopecten yessoensis]OWF38205.1 hypothetical protein KP79_PYT19416 [Mizuhopecten yessoensis]